MDKFLLVSAAVLFIFGILLMLRPTIVKRISEHVDKVILRVDDKMHSSHLISGAILVLLGIIVFYLSIKK